MCCFSTEVQSVKNTRIFARLDGHGRQFVIYAMSVATKQEVAMVLPLPVASESGESAVTFVNLEKYPLLFDDMAAGFPRARSYADPFAAAGGAKSAAAVLPVEQVGAFEASYVPTVADFSRLDKRFRMPAGTWEKLPGYAGFGFAVFKLRKGVHDVHPMAFSFASGVPDRLFFPTLHIHDGEVHPKAEFDHTLYCQGSGLKHGEWRESPGIANQFMKPELTKGVVFGAHHIYKRELNGELANTDWLVKARSLV